MNKKNTTTIHNFENLDNASKGYAAISFNSISSVKHQHLDYYEIILITSGEFRHSSDNTTVSFPRGTLALFGSGTAHQLSTEPFKSTYFCMCIEKHYFERYISRVFPDLTMSFHATYISTEISVEKLEYIEHLGTKITKNSQPLSFIADKILFLSMMTFSPPNNILDYNLYIAEIIQKLNSRFYMNASVEDICSDYPYSHAMLLRYFKKKTGMTIVEYKAQQKLKYAGQLLAETDDKIIDISTSLQYNSLSHFLRTFKHYYGMTPSEYRKKYREYNHNG